MLLAQRRQSTDPYHYNPTFSRFESTPRTKEQKFQSSGHAALSIPFNYQLSEVEQNYIQQLNINVTQTLLYGERTQLIEHTPRHISQQERLMQSEQPVSQSNWQYSNGQLTPVSARNHNRESSLSSLNSVGPASPYTLANSQHAVILPSNSFGELYYDGLADQNTYSFSKTTTGAEDYLSAAFQHNYSLHSYNTQPAYNQLTAMQKQNMGEENMPDPEYSHTPRPSVASTHDSPATPSGGDDFDDMNRRIEYRAPATVPKLDRTMSDVYNDELYSPSFTFTSAPLQPSQKATQLPSHQSDVFSQRLAAANNQHLRASSHTPLPNHSRGRSPFRQGSPLAPTSNQAFSSHPSTQVRLGSAAQMREQQKDEEYARALEEHAKRSSPEQSTPKTISPKDALLEYHETEEDVARPLFPPQQVTQYQVGQPMKQEAPTDVEDSSSQQSFASMATSRRESSSAYSNSSQTTQRHGSGFNFAPPSVPGVQVPQQYPFVPQLRQTSSSISNDADRSSDYTPNMNSMEAGFSDYSDSKKPLGVKADSGTYTCTYHGCTLRFETPAKLQKHKREGHRQSVPLLGGSGSSVHRGSDASSGMTSAALLRNSQAGPHKCERINPSTGKPCNTIFSRPYDLTRHEDTIHNARKQKVRCHLCTEEKTFSRNDALTRHMRVVHPEVDFPGKHKRRL